MLTTLSQANTDTEFTAEQRIAVQARLRPSIYEKARRKAKREGIPIGKVIEDAIDNYIEDQSAT